MQPVTTVTVMYRTSAQREILRLAVPAFLALVAEPLFLLADSAIVGHLGTAPLAGLGVASAALLTAANIYVFLAYGTTSLVARRLGAGDERSAVSAGLDGVWLSIALGAVTALATAIWAGPLCELFGASADALAQATTYLRISALGVPAMLVVLAATGVLRGFQDTRTPLVAAVTGFGANIVLNLSLVYGLDLGIAGSAWGTVLAQTGMAAGLLLVVTRRARALHARLRPHPTGVLRAALGGVPLLIRTLALRGAMLLTTWVAAGLGDVPLAAHQVAMTVFGFLAFALDALAIAAQALTGKALGAGDVEGTRAATRLMLWWGLGAGVLLGAVVLAVHQVLPLLFTSDQAVRDALAAALLVVALVQPVSGLVFVLDGVLIGAGDGVALAVVQVAVLAAYVPVLLLVRAHVSGAAVHTLTVLWWSFAAFMAFRLLALAVRARSDRWLVTGAVR
ncbi:MATE family efflux transporter [Luteipulveratus sp. YIM 133296]|uniref:MATE family efflux transporter n=2 Tax=Luteipulveratus flavus TaxID=3031728 RepID=A0ABT6C4M9_9MICO|nr:MATE family efflux transporter [Luteipulveratus sp. YIM 133296]MDF8263842.1 MATE family efflux transporter [Luteipulveratus sp. YIM 133296]